MFAPKEIGWRMRRRRSVLLLNECGRRMGRRIWSHCGSKWYCSRFVWVVDAIYAVCTLGFVQNNPSIQLLRAQGGKQSVFVTRRLMQDNAVDVYGQLGFLREKHHQGNSHACLASCWMAAEVVKSKRTLGGRTDWRVEGRKLKQPGSKAAPSHFFSVHSQNDSQMGNAFMNEWQAAKSLYVLWRSTISAKNAYASDRCFCQSGPQYPILFAPTL